MNRGWLIKFYISQVLVKVEFQNQHFVDNFIKLFVYVKK